MSTSAQFYVIIFGSVAEKQLVLQDPITIQYNYESIWYADLSPRPRLIYNKLHSNVKFNRGRTVYSSIHLNQEQKQALKTTLGLSDYIYIYIYTTYAN